MAGTVLYYLMIVVVWISVWGLGEMLVDKISNGNLKRRMIVYIVFGIIGIAILALLGAFVQ
jgi:hypothetical protein